MKPAVPVTLVRVSVEPSPKSTIRDSTCRGVLLPPVPPAVAATEIGTGTPTVPLSGAVMVIAGALETVTVTSPAAVELAVARTVAVVLVFSVVRAMPSAPDSAVVALRVPAVDVNSTVTPGSGLLDASKTRADTVTTPPLCEMLGGVATTARLPAAAAPIFTSTPPPLLLPEPVLAPPE